MAYCRKCGSEMSEQAIKCSECGEVHIQKSGPSDDRGSFLHVLIGLCVPIIGLILFIVWNKDRPNSARNALIGALISLPIIVILGIISAFVIPATGQIIDNTQRSIVYADALAIEHATELYCLDTLCSDGDEITYGEISGFIDNFDESYYVLNNQTVVAVRGTEGVRVYLEAEGTGNYEFRAGLVPTNTTRDESVIEDTN